MKNLWIIAPFSNIESIGTRNRFQYLANRMHNEGYKVTLFTSNFSHIKKKHVPEQCINKYPFEVILIDEPGYLSNVSLRRILSHLKFTLNLRKYMKTLGKPDLVYAAYPTMTAAYIAGKYANKYKLPFFLDIQDVWPESISSAIDINKPWIRIIMWPLTKFANKIYKMPDVVFGVSETYVNRAKVKGTKAKHFIPVYIGAELEKFTRSSNIEIVKNAEEIWLTYIGTISHSYDLETAVKAMTMLRDKKEIKLHILGTGPDENRIVNLAKQLGIYMENVIFHGQVEYEKVLAILKKSDIALNAIKGSAKQTITNKLGDYIAAGLPILNSCQEIEVKKLIETYNIGLNYESGNSHSLKENVLLLISDKCALKYYSENSKKLARDSFNRSISYKVIVDKINEFT